MEAGRPVRSFLHQARDDGGLDQGGRGQGSKKRSNIGYPPHVGENKENLDGTKRRVKDDCKI